MESKCLMDKLSIAFFLSPGGQKDFYPSIQTSVGAGLLAKSFAALVAINIDLNAGYKCVCACWGVIHPLKKSRPRLTFLMTKKLHRNLLFGCIYLTFCQRRSSLSR